MLLAFGGSAPLRACSLAERLGIETVLIPVDAAVGSAVGFFSAPLAFEALEPLAMRLRSFDARQVNAVFRRLWHRTVQVVAQGRGEVEAGEAAERAAQRLCEVCGAGL